MERQIELNQDRPPYHRIELRRVQEARGKATRKIYREHDKEIREAMSLSASEFLVETK